MINENTKQKLEKIFEENSDDVEIYDNYAIAKYCGIFEMVIIAIINTFEANGVKCNEYYYDEENEDFVIPFINEVI